MNQLRVCVDRIRRRWLLILLVGVIAAAGSAAAVALEPASYTARATLTNVSPQPKSKPEQDIALAQGYADYFNQVSTQGILRARSGADPTAQVTARLAAAGPILYIEAEADDARVASDTATRMATALRDDVNAGLAANGSLGSDPRQASNQLRAIALDAGVVRDPSDIGRTAWASLVGGLLLGALGAIALGRYDKRIVSPAELAERLDLDVLAVVTGRGRSGDGRAEMLRSLMPLTDVDGMPRPGTLVVTGPSSSRRSQALVALALTGMRARQGQPTLLVQADPEAAALVEPAALAGASGVTDFLGEGSTARLGGRVRGDGQGLLVCPVGSRRADQMLYTKTQFRRLLSQAAETADLVVVTAPPVDTVEGRAVCAAADRSVLVVEEGVTRVRDAAVALDALGEAGATALGAVLVRDASHLTDPGVLHDGPWGAEKAPADLTQPIALPGARSAPPAAPSATSGTAGAEPVTSSARSTGGDS